MNLGQEGTWYPPPQGYNYVQQVPEKVKSMDGPEKKNECEVGDSPIRVRVSQRKLDVKQEIPFQKLHVINNWLFLKCR